MPSGTGTTRAQDDQRAETPPQQIGARNVSMTAHPIDPDVLAGDQPALSPPTEPNVLHPMAVSPAGCNEFGGVGRG